jgi:acetyltransferase-like isoleucine patch superfamily enzyme
VENSHLLELGVGSYYDREIEIISWSDIYRVIVGKYCSIGRDSCFFLHANHRQDWITTSSQLWGPVTPEIASMHMGMGHPACKGDIVIQNDVWVGAKVSIMSGITIENGAVVAATATVTKDVPPYAIVAGNPAVVKGYRFSPTVINKLLAIAWWDWPQDKNMIKNEAMLLWSDNVDMFIKKHYQETKVK